MSVGLLASFPEGLGGPPFSTAQAAVGALAGAMAAAAGPAALGLPALAAAAAAWILVPLAAAVAAQALADGPPPALRWAALLVPAVLLLAAPRDPGWVPGLASLAVAALALVLAAVLARVEPEGGTWSRAGAAAALGLAVGATEAAHVLGPVAAAVGVLEAGAPTQLAEVPPSLRLLAAGALVLGFAGWRPPELAPGGSQGEDRSPDAEGKPAADDVGQPAAGGPGQPVADDAGEPAASGSGQLAVSDAGKPSAGDAGEGPAGTDPGPPVEAGSGGGGEGDVVALAGGAALPVSLAAALAVPASGATALAGAALGLQAAGWADGAPVWRRLAAGALLWPLLAALAGGLMGGLLVGLLA